jgi:hypothetical protein
LKFHHHKKNFFFSLKYFTKIKKNPLVNRKRRLPSIIYTSIKDLSFVCHPRDFLENLYKKNVNISSATSQPSIFTAHFLFDTLSFIFKAHFLFQKNKNVLKGLLSNAFFYFVCFFEKQTKNTQISPAI